MRTLEIVFKSLGLFVGIFGVLLYNELTYPFELLCWLPITLGYCIWFGRWLR